MNYNNLAQKTNFTAGSDKFKNLPFYLTSINIPGINFSLPEVGGRAGSRLALAGDVLTYNGLSFEMLIDEDFNIYHEFMDQVIQNISPTSGQYADNSFDFWVEINNNKGHKILKIEFTNCRIESIGDIFMSTIDDSTESIMTVDVKYDHYTIIKNERSIPVLATE